MVPTLHGLLQTGVSGVKAHQTAIATTAHNIANTGTEGYTRQRVGLEAMRPLGLNPGQIGTGVQVDYVRRMRDTFLDAGVRTQLGREARYNQHSESLQTLEVALGDIEDGNIGGALTNFFNSWHDLSTAPEDLGVRQVVIDKAVALTDYFRSATTTLATHTTQLDFQVNQTAADINGMIQRVAELNTSINRAEFGNLALNDANDFRDQRDLLLDKLSQFMDLTVVEQPNRMVDVTVNGAALVTGQTSFAVTVAVAGVPPHPEVRSSGGVPLATIGGTLRGIGDSYASTDQTRATLDALAVVLRDQVNSRHTAGFDRNGAAGVVFFVGADAATLAVNAVVGNDPARVAAATAPAPGNNGVALQMVQLQDTLVYPAGVPTATLNEAFRNLVTNLGSQARAAFDQAEAFHNSAVYQEEQRQAVSGVNMDEELSNLVAFQRAYEASARVVTVIDEAMDTIINRMGRVGL